MWRCGDVVAIVWRDKKLVHVLATNTTPTATTKKKNGSVVTVPVPLAVNLYNTFMGGFDRADHTISGT